MILYDHQKRIIEENKPSVGIFTGTGSGKTRTALLLAHGKTLVIAPKTQVLDQNWQREAVKIKGLMNLTVISKETFRRDYLTLPAFDTLILDEAHTLCGVTPAMRYRKGVAIPKTSQLFEATIAYLKRCPPKRLYTLTATPARNPMAVYALGLILGRDWIYRKFRQAFYIARPINGREVYMPRKDKATKHRLAMLVQAIGYIGRLDDFFDVPPSTFKTIHCPLTKEQQTELASVSLAFPDPLVLLGKQHQIEQGFLIDEQVGTFKENKTTAILDLLEEYPKALIFAKYTAQIHELEARLKEAGIETFVLTGATKDRGTLLKDAEKSKRCAVIAQAQISAGYELPSFRLTIFASCSYSTVDHEQALGRTLRANNLQKNLYVYLQSGDIDAAVLACLKNHQDFNEILYAQTRSRVSDKV